MTPSPRPPEPGEIQIAVLLGGTTFLGWAQAHAVDGVMDSFERRARIAPEDRNSRLSQAAIRARIAADLRGPDAERLFTEVLAAGCLWLALRHWSDADAVTDGVARQIAADGHAVVTASIADPAPEGSAPDTAWAFMVGRGIHDGRDQLARIAPGAVEVFRRDDAPEA